MRSLVVVLAIIAYATANTCEFTGSLLSPDPTMSSRVWRDNVATSCSASHSCTVVTGSFYYDVYDFTSLTAGSDCVTVALEQLDPTGNEIEIAAYAGSHDPSNACPNLVADPGTSPTFGNGPISFTYNAIQSTGYKLVVSTTSNGGISTGYKLTVTGNNLQCGSIPPSCNKFDTTKYGAPKPTVAASLVSGSNIKVDVTMSRQTVGNTGVPVFHNVDTAPLAATTCRSSSDNTVPSAGVAWTSATTGCDVKYTLTQSLSEIVGGGANNNWVATLAADGKSITYTMPVYATYSVNNADGTGGCYYVGFRSTVSFRTQLSVASTSTSFTTADNSARFSFYGLRITSASQLEITGKIIPLVPNSELRSIALTKTVGSIAIPTTTTTCNAYNVGCDQTYSVAVATISANGLDISDSYVTTMEVWEGGAKTRDASLTYQLKYIIPTDPTVVDSDTVTTENKLYTDSSYNTVRTYAYSSLAAAADNLYIENSITATSPAIPSTYKLRMQKGYLCCVNYLTAISPYNPTTDTGGCRDSANKLEWVDLTASAAAQYIPSETVGVNKKYRVQVALNSAYNGANIPHPAPMTCQVLLVSKLEAPARRIATSGNDIGSGGVANAVMPANMAKTFVATVPFVVAAPTVSSANVVGASLVTLLVLLVNML